jgi:hypothetical protein
MRLQTDANHFPVYLKFYHMGAKAVALTVIGKLVSHSVTQLFNITLTDFIAQWDCQICSWQSIKTRFNTYGLDSPVRLEGVKWYKIIPLTVK